MGALALGLPRVSAAQRSDPSASYRLAMEGCPVMFGREIRWLLEIELPLRDEEDPAGGVDERTDRLVAVQCIEGSVLVSVTDNPTGTPLYRRLDLDQIPTPARARLVALAVAELTASLAGRSFVETPAIKRSPASRPAPRPASRPGRPPGPQRRWLLAVAGSIGALGDPLTSAFGGGLTTEHRALGRFGWRVDVVGLFATARIPLGRARISLLSASATATARVRLPGRAGMLVGLGGRLGLAHLAGDADSPTQVNEGTVIGACGGPLVALGLRTPISGRSMLMFDVEATYISLPVRGHVGGEAGFGVEGLWLLGKVGVGISL